MLAALPSTNPTDSGHSSWRHYCNEAKLQGIEELLLFNYELRK